MKRFAAKLPHYFELLIGAALVVITLQYVLITGVLNPVHPVFSLIQICFYLLLALAVYHGIVQRSKFAWLVVQLMLVALFVFSLLFAAVCAALVIKGGIFWGLLFTVLLTAVVNGLLMGFLFSLPARDCFSFPDNA